MEFKKIKGSNFFSKWSNFFIRKYKVTILLLVALIIAGAWGLTKNQRQDFPEITVNYAIVTAVYPGASAENIEKEIINPIETEVKSQEKVGRTRSTSSANFGSVSLELETFDAKEIETLVTEVRGNVEGLNLPQEVELKVFSPEAMGPTVSYILVSDNLSQQEILENSTAVKEYLENASDDIKKIEIQPKAEFDIEIILDSKKITAKKISPATVKQTVQGYINTLPAGSIVEKGKADKQIDIKAPITAIKDLKNISFPGGVKLSEIATVKRTVSDEETMAFAGYIKDGTPTFNDESVYLMVYKEANGDIIRIHDKLTEAVNDIHKKGIIPENITVAEVYNTADSVRDNIGQLLNSGLIGLLAILIIFLFFIDLRTGIVISLVIPLAFLITLFILPLIGFTINILTLFAMILTLGILVDNAIVIAEGIVHRIQKYKEGKYEAAIKTVRDIGPAVTAATLTTIVVFIPFAQMGGIMGEIIKFIPYTIIIMLIVSYFLAITITPLFSTWILKKSIQRKRDKKATRLQKMLVLPAIVIYGQKLIGKAISQYEKFMERVYRKKLLRVGLIVLIVLGFIGSISLVATGQVPSSQFPKNDGWTVTLSTDFPKGTNVETKKEVYQEIFQEMIKTDHFESAFNFEEQILMIITPPKERRDSDKNAFDIEDELTKKMEGIMERAPEGTYITVNAQGHGPPENYYDVVVELKNKDQGNLEKAIASLDEFIKNKEANNEITLKRVKNEIKDELVPVTEINFNQNKTSKLGISPFVTSTIINSIFSQSDIAKLTVREDGIPDDVVMKFSDQSRDSIEDLKNIVVAANGRQIVPLKAIADVKNTEKIFNISHIDERKALSYNIAVAAGSEERAEVAAQLETDIKNHFSDEKLEELHLDKDDISYGGFANEIGTNFNDLIIIFVLALLAVYIILVYQFNSYLQPLLIMLTIPIALIGVFPGIKLVGGTVDMISGLGIIALVGIVVNDAIIFIDYFNRQKKKHPDWSIHKNLIYTGKVRFRPIFSTSITTIVGILPITIIDPFWRGLGTSVISGLIFSTIGTLIILPILINMFTRKVKGKNNKK